MNSAENVLEVLIKIGLLTPENADKARAAIAEVGKETEKTAESTEQWNIKGREAYRLFGELDRIVPGLGEALRGLNALGFNPLIAVSSMVAFGFYEAKKALTEFNQSLDDSAKAAADHTFLAGIQARMEVLNSAATAAREYAEKEAAIALHEQSIATALEDQLQLMAAIEAARGQQTQAQKALALAQIGLKETGGQITPSQGIEQRAEIEREFAQREYQEKRQAQLDKLHTDQLNLFVAQQAQKLLDTAKTAADETATGRAARYAAASKDFENYNTPEKVQALLKPIEDRLQQAEAVFKRMSGEFSDFSPERRGEALAPYARAVDAAQQDLNRVQGQIDFFSRHGGEQAKTEVEAAQSTAKLADQKAQQGLDAIQKLQEQVDQQSKLLGATGPVEAATQRTKLQTISATETTELQKQARADIDRYGRDISSGNLRDALVVIQDLRNALNGHAQVLEYVKGLGVDVRRLEAVQWELKREIQQYGTQLGNHGP